MRPRRASASRPFLLGLGFLDDLFRDERRDFLYLVIILSVMAVLAVLAVMAVLAVLGPGLLNVILSLSVIIAAINSR